MTLSVLERDNETMRDALDILAHGKPTYDRTRPIRDWSTSRIRWDLHRREVYSYGDHFPLLRFIPRGRRRPLIVLNGDEWRGGGWHPSRTPDHQWQARALARELGAETIVIPFSALGGAAIDIDSIRPVQVRDDSEWQETHTVATLAEVPAHLRETYNPAANKYEPRAPNPDGSYSWTARAHRLGDCIFSAVREETYTRPARAFETDSETARAIVECPAPRERYCHAAPAATDNRTDLHETGPSGACIHCGRALQARVTLRRRAVFVSSFDYQERWPLYFLAQLPRGARADTVDDAIEALAPRAVHAARARGIPVERQGDIFFIRTGLTLEDLEARGIASRARLTQWTRDARARRGEVGYTAPLDASGRRRMAKFRRAEWLRITRDARIKLEHREAPAAGPKTERGARRRWAKTRAADARDVAIARARLRALLLGAAPTYRGIAWRYAPVQRYTRQSPLQLEREALARAVTEARARLETIERRAAANRYGRAAARDSYRAPFRAGPAAIVAWSMAGVAARARFIPSENHGPAIEARREKVRRALAVYGTAHSATEVIRTRAGAVYVTGTVRHVPALEPNRTGAPDHAPLELGPGYWLAVRNTVPRSDTRRRV